MLTELHGHPVLWQPHAGPQTRFLESNAYEVLYGGAAGGGKALCVHTPLPTPTGWTTMGDVAVGDTLIDERGEPCRVTWVSPVRTDRDCYRVVFSDGAEIIADGDHQWATSTVAERSAMLRRTPEFRAERRSTRPSRGTGKRPDLALRNAATPPESLNLPDLRVRTTKEIAATLVVRNRKNHAIPVCAPWHLPHANLPVPPYVLGAWLGDGTSSQGSITCVESDRHIADAIRGYGFDVDAFPKRYRRGVRGLAAKLRTAGVLNNKHIPLAYLRSSLAQRLALLQGLMDTDGHASADGKCEFTGVNRRLVDGVSALLHTLGIKHTVAVGTATIKGRVIGDKYRITFTTALPAFSLPRKAARQRKPSKRSTATVRYVVDVERVESVPVKCIGVDSPSHLFLAGREAIPTHNSHALLFGSLRQVHHPQYRALILRRTFPELRELMDAALPIFTGIGATWNVSEKRFRFPSGALIDFGYASGYADVLQYQGQAFQYIGFDELGQIPEERVWTYLISRNRPTAPDQILQMRASANPGGKGHHWLKKRFVTPCPDDGTPVTIDGFTRAFVAAKLKDNPTLMENDPSYGERLALLPELERRWLAEGDWDAGAGLALDVRKAHLVKPFDIPEHWVYFSALDWGYNHPFSWGLFAADDDGNVYLVDTATGRHLQPPQIADRFRAVLGKRTLRYSVAGHDVWADVKARSENIPTLFEQFVAHGFPMVKANISRIAGVQNLRRYLAVPESGPPMFRLFDTPNNRAVFECLESRVSDEKHPEDVLKVDADQEGNGGDDHYDMVRYGLASRPIAATKPLGAQVKQDDRAVRYDWKNQRFPDKSPDNLMEKLLRKDAGTSILRHRVPRNPR